MLLGYYITSRKECFPLDYLMLHDTLLKIRQFVHSHIQQISPGEYFCSLSFFVCLFETVLWWNKNLQYKPVDMEGVNINKNRVYIFSCISEYIFSYIYISLSSCPQMVTCSAGVTMATVSWATDRPIRASSQCRSVSTSHTRWSGLPVEAITPWPSPRMGRWVAVVVAVTRWVGGGRVDGQKGMWADGCH